MAALAAACSSAFAADSYAYVAYLNGAGGHSAAGGNLTIQGVDPTKSIRVEVTPLAGPANAPFEAAAPGASVDLPFIPGLAGGDTVTVWQPADKSEAPTEHVLEAPTIRFEDGSLKGTRPAGFNAEIQTDSTCEREAQQFLDVPAAFDYPFAGAPGMFMTISASNAAGDQTVVTTSAAGETPCFRVNASSRISGYKVAATHLNGTTADSSKLELTRNGAVIDSASGDGTGAYMNSAVVPQPGDVIKLYNPADEATPESLTIPTVSATFDTTTDQVSVNAPAAGALRVTPQATIQFRLKRDVAAGSTAFDFAQPADSFPAYDIKPGNAVYAEYVNVAHTLEYNIDASDTTPSQPTVIEKGQPDPPKDITRPKIDLTLAKALRFPSGGLSLRLVSSESARIEASMVLRAQGRLKSVKLASSARAFAAGSGKFKLSLTRAGKKALKALKTKRRAILTLKATDAAGNTSTLARTTTIKP